MSKLPTPIRDFILTLTDENLCPAYLLLSNNGELLEWGGDLQSYGIQDLQRNMNTAEHIPFLIGLLPLDSNSVFLPNVQTTDQVFANLYLFEREQGTWILLLDASADIARRRPLQQRLYDSRLQVSDLQREGDALYKANAVLEELVRERTAELTRTVLRLQQELAARKRVEKKLEDSEARKQAT